jgi:hypothetical protein
VSINAIADEQMEGPETVILTLQGGALHAVAPGAATATATIADTPPKVLASQQHYRTLPHELSFDFSRDVSASLSVADILVRNLTTGGTIVPDALSFDASANRAAFSFDAPLPDGNYRATLDADGIEDALGTTLAADYSTDFHFFLGDANHDGRVNLQDFNILAANFGQSPRDFADGDFSYDGVVNLHDFNLLASRFGTGLASAPFANRFAAGTSDDEDDEDDENDKTRGGEPERAHR